MNEIMISLSRDKKTPLYQQIYEHIKVEVIDGRISCGEKIPSTRFLAEYLQVSRSTVELAYEQLVSEGYIEAKPYRGYFVCDVSELYDFDIMSEEDPEIKKVQKPKRKIDFSPNEIDLEHFPFGTWRKVSKNILSEDNSELFRAGEGAGEVLFRESICHYLYQSRGVLCTTDQIIVGAGNEYLLMLLSQILGTEKCVAMETPTYMQAYATFRNLGYNMVGVSMDKHGMDITKLQKEKADVAYVMPSHQFPMGTVMPLKRRAELLNWAAKENSYIIEDDHDSEFRYKGKPIPSLQGADKHDRVIYLGTFSKSIAPALRVSYMVLPKHLMEEYRQKCAFYASTVPRTQQMIIAAFMKEGYFERHLNKMRSIYRKKHDFLMEELKKRAWVRKIYGDNAGMHVLVEVDSKFTDVELEKLALGTGIQIYSLSEYDIEGIRQTQYPTILLGYGSLGEEKIKEGLKELDRIIRFF